MTPSRAMYLYFVPYMAFVYFNVGIYMASFWFFKMPARARPYSVGTWTIAIVNIVLIIVFGPFIWSVTASIRFIFGSRGP